MSNVDQSHLLMQCRKVKKVVQPVNLVDRKYLSNHSLTENIWGKSRYVLSILAYHWNLSAKA
jgi:hypothetical protein